MRQIPKFETERTFITVLSPNDFELLLRYRNENATHLAPWEPLREPSYYSPEEGKNRIKEAYEKFFQDTAVHLVGLDKHKQEIIGMCNFTNIIWGPFQACNLGYSVAKKYQGKGFMYEILKPSIDYIFKEFEIHRIMANHIPTNVRSAKLLTRLGFEKEGLAKSYLKIAGRWQDHVLTAKINPSHLNS
ncbi:MAG: ribosomal protein S5-alanine N-acetyltransferase [Candidatus Riflebacteria bacterium]|nr:ribosomal protein S5-alanine N-acetyltransferase [Candidatus Riflebacteria bacterium]